MMLRAPKATCLVTCLLQVRRKGSGNNKDKNNPRSNREDVVSGTVSGKSIIVTGAGHGSGAEIARDHALNGAMVCIADLNFDAAKKLASEIGRSSSTVLRGWRTSPASPISSHRRVRTT
jgi:hypothetical protein